jgi:hypothetical protein
MKNNLVLGIGVLSIWTLISIVMISTNEKRIKWQAYEISELTEKTYELEKKISVLEYEKEELENQINDFDSNLRNNLLMNDYSRFSNQFSSDFNRAQMDESEVFSSQGKAVVVHRTDGCDYMILENNSGYIIAQWIGGNDPQQGENIGGNFRSFGSDGFYNLSSKSKTRLWVDDFMLSKRSAFEKINDKCR